MKAVYIVHAIILAIAIAMTAVVFLFMVKPAAEGGGTVEMQRGAISQKEQGAGPGSHQ